MQNEFANVDKHQLYTSTKEIEKKQTILLHRWL